MRLTGSGQIFFDRTSRVGRLPVNPFAWYDFQDSASMIFSSGTTVSSIRDKSGNNRDLTASGTVSYVDGIIRQATNADYLFNNASPSDWNFLHNDSSSTVILLIKNTLASDNIPLSTATSSFGNPGMVVRLFTAGEQLRWYTGNNAGAAGFFAQSANGAVPINQWNLLSLKRTRGTNSRFTAIGYNNGGSTITSVAQSNNPTAVDCQGLFVGRYSNTNSTGFVGDYAQLLIYDRALSALEIKQIEEWANEKLGGNANYTAKPVRNLVQGHGQSNMIGDDLITNSSTFTNNELITSAQTYNNGTNSFANLQVGVTNGVSGGSTTTIGPECGMMDEIVSRQQSAVTEYLSKYGVGNTAIAEFLDGGTAYTNLDQLWSRSIENLELQGIVPRLHFLWFQGEADADDETLANAYFDNLQTLYSERLASSRGLDISSIAVVRTARGAPGFTYGDTVRQAEQDFCDQFSFALRLDRPRTFQASDTIHDTADSSEQIGRDAGAWFVNKEQRYVA